jgi:predicted ATPase
MVSRRGSPNAGAEVVRLKPLPLTDVRMLVRAIGGEGELSDDAAEAIAIRSDGMPIFAEELTRGYIESAPRADAGDELSRIPATLAETILARANFPSRCWSWSPA